MTENSSELRISSNQLFCNLSGEAVILNLTNGTYYGLNEVGTRIWELLQQNRSIKEIGESLLEEYHVEEQACRRAVEGLVEQLLAKGLIEDVHSAL